MLRTYPSLYLYSIMALDGGKSLIGFTKKVGKSEKGKRRNDTHTHTSSYATQQVDSRGTISYSTSRNRRKLATANNTQRTTEQNKQGEE